jgi:thiol:disulfide interchange protein
LLFFVIGVLIMPFARVETENTFSLTNTQKALNDGKVVYAVVDTPWCLSCQLGKASFMASSLVRKMIANKDIVVLKATAQNPDILALADTFELNPMPLHILYTKDKADGEIMPWFIQNYGAARMLQKAGVKINN